MWNEKPKLRMAARFSFLGLLLLAFAWPELSKQRRYELAESLSQEHGGSYRLRHPLTGTSKIVFRYDGSSQANLPTEYVQILAQREKGDDNLLFDTVLVRSQLKGTRLQPAELARQYSDDSVTALHRLVPSLPDTKLIAECKTLTELDRLLGSSHGYKDGHASCWSFFVVTGKGKVETLAVFASHPFFAYGPRPPAIESVEIGTGRAAAFVERR